MQCRISDWKRNGKVRCRTVRCPRRRIEECVEDDWWEALPLPSSTKASTVCGRGCTEETVVVDPNDKRIPRRLRRKPSKRR